MIIRSLCMAPIIFVGWIGVLAATMVLSDDAPAALVFFPSGEFLARVPDGTSLISHGPVSLTVAGDTENFGWELYQSGALLVLPAGLSGCLGV